MTDIQHAEFTKMVPRPAQQVVPAATSQQQEQVVPAQVTDSSLLARLQPPPLPLWAVPHASAALSVSRLSLIAAQAASNTGFKVARIGTRYGFAAARTLLTPLLSGAGIALDHALGTNDATGKSGAFANTPQQALQGIEALALFGINIGSTVTNVVLGSANSTVAMLEGVYGNDEAVRTLQAFLRLVQDEWSTSLPTDPYATGGLSRFSLLQVGKAAGTWAALQSVTVEHEGRRIAGDIEELDMNVWGRVDDSEAQHEIIWEITDEQTLEDGGSVIEAQIDGREGGEESLSASTEEQTTREQLKRFSKMCLGSYGGMGVLFFGVRLPTRETSPPSNRPLTAVELAKLSDEHRASSTDVSNYATPRTSPTPLPPAEQAAALERQLGDLQLDVDIQQMEIRGDETAPSEMTDTDSADLAAEMGFSLPKGKAAQQAVENPSLWELVTGKHDSKLLQSFGGFEPETSTFHKPDHEESSDDDSNDEDYTATTYMERKAVRARERQERTRRHLQGRRPPRFYVVTDYPNRCVLLVLRGTSSIDDLATDLACEPSIFDDTCYWETPTSGATEPKAKPYQVHGGMDEMAEALGGNDGQVTRAVARALTKNPDFSLFIVGHSLGAGVGTLLGLRWGNPETGLTSSKSGLPAGRPIRVYAFAPPCVADAELSIKAKKIVHSFVYSGDAVTRFSLGHVRDIRSAAAWLCFANDANPEDASNNILSRIIAYKAGKLDKDSEAKGQAEQFFTAAREALEEKQQYAELFPAGDILWMVNKDDVKLPNDTAEQRAMPHRLFKVTGRPDVVFKQMSFSQNMLSTHLPHQYANVIAGSL